MFIFGVSLASVMSCETDKKPEGRAIGMKCLRVVDVRRDLLDYGPGLVSLEALATRAMAAQR